MRSNLLACFLMAFLPAGCAFEGEVVHKISRPRPETSMIGMEGIHSFVFRGPTGTSRPPITIPGPEFWSSEPSGKYAFFLRDRQGNARWQLVTPEVFARYQIGEYFNDLQSSATSRNKYDASDNKSQPVIHHRRKTAQVRRNVHPGQSHRALAKHRRHHRSNRVAQNKPPLPRD